MLLNRLFFKSFFVFLLVFGWTFSFAQTKTADLLNELKKAQSQKNYRADTANVLILAQLSDLFVYDNADKALSYAKQAMQLAEFQNNNLGRAHALDRLGKAYYVLGDYRSSLNSANSLMNTSTKMNYQPGVASAYLVMGLVYLAQDNNAACITDLNKALRLFIQQKNDGQTGKVYFDLGICYDESGETAKAFSYLDKAIAIANNVKDNTLLSMTFNRMGEIYFHTKNYNEALVYYTKVVGSPFTNNWERDFAWSGIAQCDFKLGAYNLAITDAQKSYALSKKVNSAFDAIRALQILSQSYAAVSDYRNAYYYQVQLKKSNDSIFNKEKDEEVNKLHLKQQQADNKRLENEIKSKEQSIAFSKRLLLFRNMIAVATAIFVLFIIINNRQKTALNKTLQKQNDDIALQKEEISNQKEVLNQLNNTKDQLFSVISHDLRSPFVAVLQSLDAIRSDDLSAKERDFLLDNFYRQVSLVTAMVNNLLVWANSQQSGIKGNRIDLDIVPVVNGIISVSNFLAKHKNITINYRHDGEELVHADADHVKIIVQNLIGNAIKFTPNDGTITIFHTDDGDYSAIHVQDTGTGISPEKMEKLFKVTGKEISGYGTNNEAGAGIGLALIKQFTDANDGKIEVQSTVGQGSEFTVYLKKA